MEILYLIHQFISGWIHLSAIVNTTINIHVQIYVNVRFHFSWVYT